MQKLLPLAMFIVIITTAKGGVVSPRQDIHQNKISSAICDIKISKHNNHDTYAEVSKDKPNIQPSDEPLVEQFSERHDNNNESKFSKTSTVNIEGSSNIQHKEMYQKKSYKKITNFNSLNLNIQTITKGHNFKDTLNPNARLKRELVSHCAMLDEKLKKERKPVKLELRTWGTPKKIVVMSTNRPPSRASAALLATAIRYKAGYEVITEIDTRNVSQLAATLPVMSYKVTFTDNRIVTHVDAVLDTLEEQRPALPNCPVGAIPCNIAGSRLQDFGRSPSVNVKVFAVLSNKTVNNNNCSDVYNWLFYRNQEDLQKCGFISSSSDCITVLELPDVYPKIDLRSKTLKNKPSFCEEKFSSRDELNQQLSDGKKSFIFIDYDLGYNKKDERVQIIQLPLESFPGTQIEAHKFSDIYFFQRFGPKIIDILNMTVPNSEHLREVLDKNITLKNIDEAACAWANENLVTFNSWTKTHELKPWFIAFFCDDEDYKYYNDILRNIKKIMEKNIEEFNFILYSKNISCSDKNIITQQIIGYSKRSDWDSNAGIAAPALGSPEIAHSLSSISQLVFYDAVPLEAERKMKGASNTISGGLQLLVNSTLHFFKKQDWKRIAIISDHSPLAESITEKFQNEIVFVEKKIKKLDRMAISEILSSLQQVDARVFYINSGFEVANLIICEAVKLGMTANTEYAWIAREWQWQWQCANDVQVFTVSYWWRGGNDKFIKDEGGSKEIRSIIDATVNSTWPLLAAPLVDAILLMVYRFQAMIRRYPERLYDFHSNKSLSSLLDSRNSPIPGVTQRIKQTNCKQYHPQVFVTSWRGNSSQLIAVWHADSDTNQINETKLVYEPYYGGKRPLDGRSHCLTTTSGDEFYPTCHTHIWATGVVLLVVISVALWWLRRRIQAQFKKRERNTLMRLLSRCERTAALLEPHLVDRSALTLYEELGSGHFGRVRFGMLRVRNQSSTPVAAKSLRDDAAPAEEAEFLREASTMARLSHTHIVRLVGVCADADGPPLLLMEHAFFGDLLKYLRQRRHLAEISKCDWRNSNLSDNGDIIANRDSTVYSDPEARHVSARELTRLGREAASALDYLGGRHLLHRDVRAANCLVDERRILKLADFGMARNVEVTNRLPEDIPEESEDYKYICRRRGIFPVPWMAPESLDRGEFSHASDVWALESVFSGVLMLEIATLGARPYGPWKPLQVLRFVQSGGRPPLPIDASYHTCELTELCWSEDPGERASAKKVYEYLLDHPVAIRAALQPAWPEPDVPDSPDSGFGERETEQEWTRGVDFRISTL